MSRLLRTPEAQQDIEQIVQHIARDNLTAALRWLDEAEAICGILVNQPEIGQRLQTRRFGEVRRHSHGNYLF